MTNAAKEFYARGLAWIAHHRGGHNGRWPPTEPSDCNGWGCVKQLAHMFDMSAPAVSHDLIDYLKRSEHGDPQP